MAELRRCDFCGGKADDPLMCKHFEDDPFETTSISWVVICKECEGEGPHGDTPDEAIAAWNTRAYDAEMEGLRAEIARMEPTVRRCHDCAIVCAKDVVRKCYERLDGLQERFDDFILLLDSLLYEKQYHFRNDDGTWYSREACENIDEQEMLQEILGEVKTLVEAAERE